MIRFRATVALFAIGLIASFFIAPKCLRAQGVNAADTPPSKLGWGTDVETGEFYVKLHISPNAARMLMTPGADGKQLELPQELPPFLLAKMKGFIVLISDAEPERIPTEQQLRQEYQQNIANAALGGGIYAGNDDRTRGRVEPIDGNRGATPFANASGGLSSLQNPAFQSNDPTSFATNAAQNDRQRDNGESLGGFQNPNTSQQASLGDLAPMQNLPNRSLQDRNLTDNRLGGRNSSVPSNGNLGGSIQDNSGNLSPSWNAQENQRLADRQAADRQAAYQANPGFSPRGSLNDTYANSTQANPNAWDMRQPQNPTTYPNNQSLTFPGTNQGNNNLGTNNLGNKASRNPYFDNSTTNPAYLADNTSRNNGAGLGSGTLGGVAGNGGTGIQDPRASYLTSQLDIDAAVDAKLAAIQKDQELNELRKKEQDRLNAEKTAVASASDQKNRRSTAESAEETAASSTLLPLLFIISFVVNLYLGVLISKLLQRYRSLLSNVRSGAAA
jgi:hypothetical protein